MPGWESIPTTSSNQESVRTSTSSFMKHRTSPLAAWAGEVPLRRVAEIIGLFHDREPARLICEELAHGRAKSSVVEEEDLHVGVRGEDPNTLDATAQTGPRTGKDDHAHLGRFLRQRPRDPVEAAAPDRRHLWQPPRSCPGAPAPPGARPRPRTAWPTPTTQWTRGEIRQWYSTRGTCTTWSGLTCSRTRSTRSQS